jgi:tetratricopeptide (TPR) repeat protein
LLAAPAHPPMKPDQYSPARHSAPSRAALTNATRRATRTAACPSWAARLCGRVSLAALGVAIASGSALAAENSPVPGPAPELPAAPPHAASSDQRVVQLNEEGSALYAAGNYRRAVELFIQAYAVDQDPNLLFNIGSCYEGLGDVEAALEKYRAFLDAPNADPDGRPRAERAIERLTQAAAQPAPEERPVEPPAPIAPAPASMASPPEAGPPSWAGWVGLGGGAVLGATGVTLYILGAADHAEVTNTSGYGDAGDVVSLTRAEADDLVRSGDTKKAIGVAAAATGGALLTGYLVWWLLDPPSHDASPTLNASIDRASGQLSLSGRF